MVSTIIPCYNAEKYIEACVKSVLDQDYRPIEIICVDNNSSDGTMAILLRLQEENPSILKITNEPIQNASAARNKGFSLSKGQYIQFLDADDVLQKQKFSVQISEIQKQRVDWIVSDRITMDESLKTEIASHNFQTIEQNPLEVSILKIIITGNPLYARKAVEKINGYNASLKSSQDWDFHLRLVLSGTKIGYLPGQFLVSRQVPDSLSSNWIKVSINTCKVIDALKNEIIQHPLYNSAIRNHISLIYYTTSIHAPTTEQREHYLEQLYFWNPKNLSFLHNPVKKWIGKIFGLPFLINLDRILRKRIIANQN